jgi:RNA polymerase sigma factor (sigma-70 family)
MVTTDIQPKVEDNLGLAQSVAQRFVSASEPVKDSEAYAEAMLALWKATEEFTPGKAFSPYAHTVIRNQLRDYIKTQRRAKRKAEFEDFDLAEIAETSRTNLTPDVATEMLQRLLADDGYESADEKHEKQLLLDVFLRGKKVADIAAKLGVTRVAVYTRLRKAIARIRDKHAATIETLKGQYL